MTTSAELRRDVDVLLRGFQVSWKISKDSRFTLNERLLVAFLLDDPFQGEMPHLLTDEFLYKCFRWNPVTIDRTLQKLLKKKVLLDLSPKNNLTRCSDHMVAINTVAMKKYDLGCSGWHWRSWMVTNTDLTLQEIAVYSIIAEYAFRQEDIEDHTIQTLARISSKMEKRIIHKLVRFGFIKVKCRQQAGQTVCSIFVLR